MKRFFLILFSLSAVSGAVFYVVSVPRERSDILAKQGVLDMRGVDLRGGVYALAGEWEFYWNRFYRPEDFRDRDRVYVSVPGTWNDAGLPRIGHGTYRLALLVEETEFELYIPEIRSAAVVWVNGKKIHEAGRIGASKAEEIPRPKNSIAVLYVDKGVVEIVVQVSSYERFYGGIRNNFRIGAGSTLLTWTVGRWSASAGISGFFFMASVYHFMLWLFRRRHRTDEGEIIVLVFSVLCFMAGVRVLIEKDGLAQYLLPDGASAFINPAGTFLLALHAILTFLFTLLAFDLKLSRTTKAVYFMLCMALLASQIAVPTPLRYRLTFLGLAPAGMAIVHTGLALKRCNLEKYIWLRLYFIALVFFVIWSPFANTMLEFYFFIPIILPNVFITLIQFGVLSQDHAEARRRARELEGENLLQSRLAAIKSRFLMNMSHEMKTPLAAMSMSAQAAEDLLREGGDMEEVYTMLDAVRIEANRSARMMRGVLAVEVTQAHGGMSELEIGALLKTTAENYRILAERGGNENTLKVDIPDALPRVLGNADELSQVLVNLITNANRHTSGGEITVTAGLKTHENSQKLTKFTKNKEIFVTVSDTGEGIEPQALPGIFERRPLIRQRDLESNDPVVGGVGLSICRDIVERHGGKIQIQSERGMGASVTFSLMTVEEHDR